MKRAIEQAVEVLRRGGLVAFPTETVYGLGADAENGEAVRRIFVVKGRPATHPLIVHLASARFLSDWAQPVPDVAWKLAERFWPGPLTLILHRQDRVRDEVTGKQNTVGLRVPAHPLTLQLLGEFGGGIAAPSANRFGAVSPTTANHVRSDLGSDVDFILDGGPCSVGIESTILDLSSGLPVLLRPGGVSREDLEETIGQPVSPSQEKTRVRAPGQFLTHYAPKAKVLLLSPEELSEEVKKLCSQGRKVAVLSPSLPPGSVSSPVVVLSLSEHPEEAACQLYEKLRLADREGCDVIVATLPPDEKGINLAVVDRLRRAAGQRG